MRKPIEQKPPLAAWATRARDEAGMSVEEVVEALESRGHRVRAATIRGIEGGSKGASVRLRRLLAEVYGVRPFLAETAPDPSTDQTALLEAIDRLALAVKAQTEAIERGLGETSGTLKALNGGVLDLLAQLVAAQAGTEADLPLQPVRGR
jgi:transcriptional regulator with XRE-family HTH domain